MEMTDLQIDLYKVVILVSCGRRERGDFIGAVVFAVNFVFYCKKVNKMRIL